LRYPPRFIFTGAENTLDFQRTAIQRATGAVLSDQYGFAEGCGNASHCTALRYHEDFEYGILECVDGTTLDADGRVRGRILATGFASPAFPFIRYEIGDVGIWEDPKKTCACGRRSRVLLSIEGRADDYVVTPEGRRIMRFDYIFKDTDHVRESQIVQHTSAGITVRIVRRPEYSLDDEDAIRRDIAKWISPRLDVRFEYLAEIPREQNGKFRAVKSALHGGT
jgi:phenylacetate-CoA ligase